MDLAISCHGRRDCLLSCQSFLVEFSLKPSANAKPDGHASHSDRVRTVKAAFPVKDILKPSRILRCVWKRFPFDLSRPFVVAGSCRPSVGRGAVLSRSGQIQSDIDDHVFLSADHFAAPDLKQDLTGIQAVDFRCALGMAKE